MEGVLQGYMKGLTPQPGLEGMANHMRAKHAAILDDPASKARWLRIIGGVTGQRGAAEMIASSNFHGVPMTSRDKQLMGLASTYTAMPPVVI